MRNKIILLTLIISLILLTGCSGSFDGSDTAAKDNKIAQDFEPIPNEENLYYCTNTKVVYWIGGSYEVNLIGDDYTTSYMTVYYAPNGFPYLYDVDKKELVEINN